MKRKKRINEKRSRRGIYVLPNIFTSLNIYFGFFSVISSINGKFFAAAVSIIIAAVFDALDGKIARATHTTSKFGVEYDSLADLISFGMAPGILIYLWALKPLGRLGWLAAFLYMVCGALRLARFNSQTGQTKSDHFLGLPIPAAAAMNATSVMVCNKFGIEGSANPVLFLITLYILSFLMVSTIKYDSFKKPELFKSMNFNVLVTVVLILIFIAAQPSIALFLLGLSYVISGPCLSILHHRQQKNKEVQAHQIDEQRSNHI
ncbi:MAG: CDP-diacylglycerol--serine O-phosphatidyltransferase [Desulfobacterales bacterium]|nr:CDP-diacylglycerol--serine O-phosphatidyltransferase [Desulfobacterales bacterium]